MQAVPLALTIAGSDSGGGAGIQADLKTFSALGVYGASVITALTAQNTRTVDAIYDIEPAFIGAQIDTVCADLQIAAVKIGMLSRPEVISTVRAALDRWALEQVVLDPVMVAKSGDNLLAPEAVEALRTELVPRARLITPNLPEAGVLLDCAPPQDEAGMLRTAERLLALGPQAVLLKGGHLHSAESVDILFDGQEPIRLTAPRIDTRNTHGTGCTLSSAITAYLARAYPLAEAVQAAKDYLQQALVQADRLQVGQGHGPVHHFHALWQPGEQA